MSPLTLSTIPASPGMSGVDVVSKTARGKLSDVPSASGGPGFDDAMSQALDGVAKMQNDATGLARQFQMENSNVSLEETMIALQKASLGFQAAVQVRNKLVTAYNDIMNMSV